MILAFELTMPGVGSWNGKWTGEGTRRVVVQTVKKADIHENAIGTHRYNWNDGWAASVRCWQVDSSEARKLRRIRNGFCGYEGWMVPSIIKHGDIRIEGGGER